MVSQEYIRGTKHKPDHEYADGFGFHRFKGINSGFQDVEVHLIMRMRGIPIHDSGKLNDRNEMKKNAWL